MIKKISKTIKIPENTKIELDLPTVIVTGPLGSVKRLFKFKNILIKKNDDLLTIENEKAKATKKDKKMINTLASHVEQMIKGVNNIFEYKLQVCSIHFPMTVKVDKEKNLLIIKNFIGENKERTTKILPDVNVEIKGDIITVKSINKESAGQQAASIESATRIRAKDRRVFQDGIWIIKKEKGRKSK